MLEYADTEVLRASGLLLSGLLFFWFFARPLNTKEQKGGGSTLITMLLFLYAILIPFWSSYSIGKDIEGFSKAATLKCSNDTTSYLVSQERGWTRLEDGFTKDDIFLDVSTCRRVDDKY